MTLVFTLLALMVLGLVVAVALGWIGGGLDAPASSLPEVGLPEGEVAPPDLERLRFAPALRGYRMDQVDRTLDRLAEELARRDAEIDRLRMLAGTETEYEAEHEAEHDAEHEADYVDAEAYGAGAAAEGRDAAERARHGSFAPPEA